MSYQIIFHFNLVFLRSTRPNSIQLHQFQVKPSIRRLNRLNLYFHRLSYIFSVSIQHNAIKIVRHTLISIFFAIKIVKLNHNDVTNSTQRQTSSESLVIVEELKNSTSTPISSRSKSSNSPKTRLSQPNSSKITYASSYFSRSSNYRSQSPNSSQTSSKFVSLTEFSVFSANPTSIVNKWSEFNSVIIKLNYPQIICLSEIRVQIGKLRDFKPRGET